MNNTILSLVIGLVFALALVTGVTFAQSPTSMQNSPSPTQYMMNGNNSSNNNSGTSGYQSGQGGSGTLPSGAPSTGLGGTAY